LAWNGEDRGYSGFVEADDEFGLGCVFERICVAPTIPLGRLVARDGVCLCARFLPLLRREVSMADKMAGIDVHKKVLMVVVMDARTPQAMKSASGRRDTTGGSARSGHRFSSAGDAEVGVTASRFSSAAEFTSWVGTCPGKEEGAEENSSSRSTKGNKYMRRVLNQAAHAAARSKGTHFQAVFRRLLPRLGYQSAVWAIAHRLCRLVWKILHQGIRYIEQGIESEPKLLIYRAQSLAKQLRKFGYNVQITPANGAPA
jgi:hypothetical protein